MRKRSLSNSGLEDLGVSESLLRDLDIAKGIGDALHGRRYKTGHS